MSWSNAFIWSFGVALAAAPACVFVVPRDTEQCNVDGDCSERGAEFEGYVCGGDKVCVRSASYCATNAQCAAANGSENWVCDQQKHGCSYLVTRECPEVLYEAGDLADNDNAIVLGLLGTPSWVAEFRAYSDGYKLARRDFVRTTKGLPSVGGTKPRPVAYVACDIPFGDRVTDPNSYQKAIDHLVDVVKAPVIFGPLVTDWDSYAISRTAPAGITYLSLDSLRPSTAAFEGRLGNFFAFGQPADSNAKLYALLASVQEEAVRRDRGVTGDVKLAYLLSDDLAGQSNLSTFNATAQLNGKAVAQNGPDLYRTFFVPLGADTTGPVFTGIVSSLTTFAPDIIVCSGSGCNALYQQYEPKGLGSYYVFSVEAALLQRQVRSEDQRRRIIGHLPGRGVDDPRFRDFQSYFSANFPDNPTSVNGVILGSLGYDLFYLAMYGMAGVGDAPLTGAAVGAQLMSRFKAGGRRPDGTPFFNGPGQIVDAVNALSRGGQLDIEGMTLSYHISDQGSIDDFPMSVWCLDANPDKSDRLKSTGLYWVSSQPGTLQGTNTCFPPVTPPAPVSVP